MSFGKFFSLFFFFFLCEIYWKILWRLMILARSNWSFAIENWEKKRKFCVIKFVFHLQKTERLKLFFFKSNCFLFQSYSKKFLFWKLFKLQKTPKSEINGWICSRLSIHSFQFKIWTHTMRSNSNVKPTPNATLTS